MLIVARYVDVTMNIWGSSTAFIFCLGIANVTYMMESGEQCTVTLFYVTTGVRWKRSYGMFYLGYVDIISAEFFGTNHSFS